MTSMTSNISLMLGRCTLRLFHLSEILSVIRPESDSVEAPSVSSWNCFFHSEGSDRWAGLSMTQWFYQMEKNKMKKGSNMQRGDGERIKGEGRRGGKAVREIGTRQPGINDTGRLDNCLQSTLRFRSSNVEPRYAICTYRKSHHSSPRNIVQYLQPLRPCGRVAQSAESLLRM